MQFLKKILNTLQKHIRSIGMVILSALLPILASAGITVLLLYFESELLVWNFWQWLVLYLGVSILMGFALMPTTLMAFLTGYFLGFEGTPLMITSYLIASYVGYQLGLFLEGKKIHKNILEKPKINRFLASLKEKSWKLIILVRLSPVLPFSVMNLVLSAIRFPIKIFLIGSFIGMMPRTLFAIYVGTRAQNLKSLIENKTTTDFPYSEIIIISLTLITIFGIGRMVRNSMKEVDSDK
jgi:uncharacterized membrane protein YdjX (TVP38/TMEM64 family)